MSEFLGCEVRVLNQGQEHGRYTEKQRDLFVFKQVEGLQGVEGFLNDGGPPDIEHGQGK